MIPFTGVVENISDPEKSNRVQTRCFGIHTEDLTKIPTASLPWATVVLPTTESGLNGIGKTPHGLLNGSWVVGYFLDSSMQDPLITGVISSKSMNAPDTEKGFFDPEGKYPRETHLEESDINRLARAEDGEEDIPTLKKKSITKEIETATEETWDEPETTYAPEYPYNKVHESESGHIHEIDDTEGAERIHEYHKAGTFREIHPDGTIVTRIVGNNYLIIASEDSESNSKLYVQGNVDLTIDQNCTTYVKGNWDFKVDGDANITIGGKLNETVEGDVTETYNSNQKTEVSSNKDESVGGNVGEDYGGNQTTKSGGNIDIDASNIFIN